MKIDGISAIAIILIASFAIDRIVTGSLFLLCFVKYWTKYFPDPATLQPDARLAAERKQKLAYFGLSGILGIALLSGYGKLRIFSVSGFPDVPAWLDTVVTGLILVGGADRMAALLSGGSPFGEQKTPHQPIEISGKITLEDGTGKKISIT